MSFSSDYYSNAGTKTLDLSIIKPAYQIKSSLLDVEALPDDVRYARRIVLPEIVKDKLSDTMSLKVAGSTEQNHLSFRSEATIFETERRSNLFLMDKEEEYSAQISEMALTTALTSISEKWDANNFYGKYGLSTYKDKLGRIVDITSSGTINTTSGTTKDIFRAIKDIFVSTTDTVAAAGNNVRTDSATGAKMKNFIVYVLGSKLKNTLLDGFINDTSECSIVENIRQYMDEVLGQGNYEIVYLPAKVLDTYNQEYKTSLTEVNQVIMCNGAYAWWLDPYGLDHYKEDTDMLHGGEKGVLFREHYYCNAFLRVAAEGCIARSIFTFK